MVFKFIVSSEPVKFSHSVSASQKVFSDPCKESKLKVAVFPNLIPYGRFFVLSTFIRPRIMTHPDLSRTRLPRWDWAGTFFQASSRVRRPVTPLGVCLLRVRNPLSKRGSRRMHL